MPLFTALPVGKGDSFLWRPDDATSVLVDGGQRRQQALCELRSRGVAKLDVMICTHGDSDHAKGLIAILKAPDISVEEVWVPARWGDGLGQLATDPHKVLFQLARECEASGLGRLESDLAPDGDGDGDGDGDELDLKDVEVQVSDGPDLENVLAWHAGIFPWFLVGGPIPSGTLWLEALEVAGHIWNVVREALHSGATLRWFKYGDPPSGGHQWLYPVNAAQTVRARRAENFLRWLRLSLKNEEALVFVGESDDSPPLLFSSDSDFQFGLGKIPQQHMLVTAPHHGSAANGPVYGLLAKHAGANHLWVRSDTPSKARPCGEYIKIAAAERACTACRRCSRVLGPVDAQVQKGLWVLSSAACKQ